MAATEAENEQQPNYYIEECQESSATLSSNECCEIPIKDSEFGDNGGKGKVLFTGPDGIRDHHVTTLEARYIGIGTMSPEGTGDLSYLWRASKMTTHPPAKQNRVGSIGWNINLKDGKNKKTGMEIKVGEFRKLCEDQTGQFYRRPWYPDERDNEDCEGNQQRSCSRQAQHEYRSGSLQRPKTASSIAPLSGRFAKQRRPQSASSTSTGNSSSIMNGH